MCLAQKSKCPDRGFPPDEGVKKSLFVVCFVPWQPTQGHHARPIDYKFAKSFENLPQTAFRRLAAERRSYFEGSVENWFLKLVELVSAIVNMQFLARARAPIFSLTRSLSRYANSWFKLLY